MQLDVLEVPNDGICLLNALLRSGCGGTAEQLLALMKRVAPAVLEKHRGFVDDFDDALEQWRIVTLEAFTRGRWGHRAFDLAPVIAAEALNCTIVICDALQQVIAAYGSGEPVLFIISTPNHFDGAKRRG
jgi:hypothetical protein